MSATTSQRNTIEFSAQPIPAGIPWPVNANTTGLKGTIGVIDLATGYLKMGVTGTGLACAGRIDGDWNTTGVAAGSVSVAVRQGVFPWYMGTGPDAITNLNVGSLCYVIDNQTVGLTDGGGTRSIAGIIQFLAPVPTNTDYQQVYVEMGIPFAALGIGSAAGGALLISGNQSNTGVKTFSDSTVLIQNAGGTFSTTLHSAATAARSFTFPDVASATGAALEGTQSWVGVKTWPASADPVFSKEEGHTLAVVATTTAATAGGALTVAAGASGTSGTGGALLAKGGAGDTTGAGGAFTGIGGAGGSASGSGGAANLTGGAGTAGNAVGGIASVTGGAANGSGTGAVAKIVGGAGGATGIGGAAQVTGGLGGTGAAGGAVVATGGAGTTTGAGGAISVTGGAGGNDAVGGAASLVGGAAGGGNRAGGAAAHTGGAGAGSAAGGASSVTGGVGGATGAGGAATMTGGAGGATSGTGGAVAIVGGAGSNGNATGGAVSIDGGAKNGSGADGLISIGVTSGSFIKFGKKLQATATANTITDPGTGVAVPVTASGSVPITQNGAESNTVADPTFMGQTISFFVDTDTSGARTITFASRINQAANTIATMTEVGDFLKVEAITIAGALKWQVVANDGATLS